MIEHSCTRQALSCTRHHDRRTSFIRTIAVLGSLGICICSAGCGPNFGAWAYMLGFYPTKKIPAEFTLPKGNLLVLVDDDRDLIQPTTAREALVDAIATKLKEHDLVDRVTTNEEIAQLRRQEPRFNERGARELGQLANADTVLWLSTMDFSINNDLEMVISPARFSVTVRVLDAKADVTDKVRLWPKDREGKLVESSVSAHEIRRCKSLKEAHELMASTLADEVVKLFYLQEIR